MDEKIVDFLEPLVGAFDIYVDLRGAEAFIHYCFERAADAEAFHCTFADEAEVALNSKWRVENRRIRRLHLTLFPIRS